ncbi:MAG: hypothetical protein IKT23_05545 [Clostridia bacterium]|nr:hypothetical protein [Clostridia bacterium]
MKKRSGLFTALCGEPVTWGDVLWTVCGLVLLLLACGLAESLEGMP